MTTDLKIAISRIEQNTCDLTNKTTECVVCTVGEDTECVIAVSKFIEFLRFEQKKLDRRSGAVSASKKAVTQPSSGPTSQK